MEDHNEQDIMFIRSMIQHHTMALSMSIEEWGRGKNQEIKDMAMKIYNAQKEEISAMRKWLDDRGLSEVYGSEEMMMEEGD